MALVEAVRFGSSPQVQALLRAGASVHNFDDDGLSMLHLAVTRNQVKAAGLLLDAGADPDYSPRCGRSPRSQAYTPQMMAVFTAHDLRKRLGKSAMSAPCKVPRRL
jgi:ankyrin repeat protein